MTWLAFIISLLMGCGALAWAYLSAGLQVAGIGLACLSLLWLLTQWRQWTWFAGVGLFVLTFAAGFGMWIGLPAGWMLAGVLGGLMAWDLSDFLARLRFADEEDKHSVVPAHLTKLGILLLVGLLLSTGAMLVQVRFSFEWAVFLALFGAWGVSLLVRWLRRGGA